MFIADATALQQELRLAIQNNIRHLQIKGDNLIVIKSVKDIWSPRWQIAHIIQVSKLFFVLSLHGLFVMSNGKQTKQQIGLSTCRSFT